MEDIRAFLAENAEKMGICLTDEQTEKFQTYAELLVEWNEKMNLTAIKEPREIAVKSILRQSLRVIIRYFWTQKTVYFESKQKQVMTALY